MNTRKFITIVTVALLVFIAIVGSVAFAVAESKNTYEVDAVIVNFAVTPFGVEVEVVDEDGEIRGYYEDKVPLIGDVVTITVYHYGDNEEDEIIDAIHVDHLSTLEMIQWLTR